MRTALHGSLQPAIQQGIEQIRRKKFSGCVGHAQSDSPIHKPRHIFSGFNGGTAIQMAVMPHQAVTRRNAQCLENTCICALKAYCACSALRAVEIWASCLR